MITAMAEVENTALLFDTNFDSLDYQTGPHVFVLSFALPVSARRVESEPAYLQCYRRDFYKYFPNILPSIEGLRKKHDILEEADMSKKNSQDFTPPKEPSLTRRRFLTRSFVVAAGGAALLASGARSVEAARKRKQKSVRYQTTPKNGKNCAGCKHFEAVGKTCKKVEGTISPDGWCFIWVKA